MAEQSIVNEAIMKAMSEATRAAIQALAKTSVQRMPNTAWPKIGGPMLREPNFNWESTDKYTEWKAFILEVRNVLTTYNLQETEKIAMVKKWIGRKGLHYIKSLTEGEKERCGTLEGLFNMLAAKFRSQYNQTIK